MKKMSVLVVCLTALLIFTSCSKNKTANTNVSSLTDNSVVSLGGAEVSMAESDLPASLDESKDETASSPSEPKKSESHTKNNAKISTVENASSPNEPNKSESKAQVTEKQDTVVEGSYIRNPGEIVMIRNGTEYQASGDEINKIMTVIRDWFPEKHGHICAKSEYTAESMAEIKNTTMCIELRYSGRAAEPESGHWSYVSRILIPLSGEHRNMAMLISDDGIATSPEVPVDHKTDTKLISVVENIMQQK